MKADFAPVCDILEVHVRSSDVQFLRMEITDTITNTFEYTYQLYSDEDIGPYGPYSAASHIAGGSQSFELLFCSHLPKQTVLLCSCREL